MTSGNAHDDDPHAVFRDDHAASLARSCRIRPVILMVAIGGVSFAAGTMFLMMGAWPVFGFFGPRRAAGLLGVPA